eukprot:g42626.t1
MQQAGHGVWQSDVKPDMVFDPVIAQPGDTKTECNGKDCTNTRAPGKTLCEGCLDLFESMFQQQMAEASGKKIKKKKKGFMDL